MAESKRPDEGAAQGSGEMARPSSTHVVDAPLGSPAASQGLLEVFRHRYLLKLLVKREINARYSGSFLGMIWSYINPLSQFFIYLVVFGMLLDRNRTENFAIHIFTGLIVVHFFVETFNAGTRSIVRNKALIRKMSLPKEMFPVASMMVSLYHVGPQVVILVIACLLYGWVPSVAGMLAFVLALGIVMLLGTALALLFSVANVFFRDFSSAVSILTNFVRFGVPMIYPYTLVEERFKGFAQYYLYNPLAEAVLLVQRAFWVGTTEDPAATAATDLPDHLYSRGVIMLVISAVILVIAQLVFRALEDKIPERLN
ncbi:Teichoic acid translocation permease protein TagG [Nocardioides dokdonensis FR1436]|uniref:Transport permease protein n=1 Tax=Nocardioides dokdonensis FR1436 TaxID=1300347 RepID=A0A1A9GG67_9ACTN|nr:ABC transporter permease [Nocardioides dokdonensis]ANH36613.1 Teichoic acid translocation permease protein TagG [Nocardioides dokdonensis FR1436]